MDHFDPQQLAPLNTRDGAVIRDHVLFRRPPTADWAQDCICRPNKAAQGVWILQLGISFLFVEQRVPRDSHLRIAGGSGGKQR